MDTLSKRILKAIRDLWIAELGFQRKMSHEKIKSLAKSTSFRRSLITQAHISLEGCDLIATPVTEELAIELASFVLCFGIKSQEADQNPYSEPLRLLES